MRKMIVMSLAAALVVLFAEIEIPAQDAAAVDSSRTSSKHLSFGQRYYKAKNFEDAETQLLRSLEFNPNEGRAAYYLGRLYNDTERYEEAVEMLNKAITLLQKGKISYKNSYYFLGQIHVYLENRPKAIAAYAKLLTLNPKREREIQYLHSLVSLSAEEEDFEAALEYARRWGELEPDNPEVRDMIAKLAMHTGGAEEALAEKEKVLEMNPNDWETLEWLGNQYKQLGETKRSFEAFARLHEHHPTNFAYLDNLFDLSQQLDKSNSYQVGLLDKMHSIQPENLHVLELLADKTSSLRWINAGLKLDAQSGRLNFLKGDFYYKKWNKDSAKQDSVRALTWYRKARTDAQWRGNAQRMIDELDPPLSDEEKKRREFFNKSKKKEEIEVTGKK
ncbi:tetratricopeptide repeat protein [bacterium]|nr:tetratricopeptide repeat protein [bacterium]